MPDANCWAIRTDRRNRAYLSGELEQGRLRQGWGYQERLDLNVLRAKRRRGEAFDDEERACWRGNRRLHPDAHGAVRAGDLVLLPHLPDEGRWTLARIRDDDYVFDLDPEMRDYGHVRHVDVLRTGIHPHHAEVSARLRGSLRTPMRMWSLNPYRQALGRLLRAIEEGRPLDAPATEAEHLSTLHREAREHLWRQFSQRFRGARFEGPVVRLFRRLYDEVEHTGGPQEQGADLVCKHHDPLGHPYHTVVQVKMWDGEGDLSGALHQIEQAAEGYEHVAAGLVLTTLEHIRPEDEELASELSARLGLFIRCMTRDEVLDLFLRHLPDLLVEDEDSDE